MLRTKEYSDRRGDAATAKAAMLFNFRKSQAAAADTLAERLASRVDIARARDERQEARDVIKRNEEQRLLDEAAKVAAEAARLDVEAKAAEDEQKNAQTRRIALVFSDEAARKALRDQRYAKRKAAQGA